MLANFLSIVFAGYSSGFSMFLLVVIVVGMRSCSCCLAARTILVRSVSCRACTRIPSHLPSPGKYMVYLKKQQLSTYELRMSVGSSEVNACVYVGFDGTERI